jgi:hypothetical protein
MAGWARRLCPVSVKATRFVSVLLGLQYAPGVWAEPMSIEELLRDNAQLQGTSVTVLGTLRDVRAHLSKHGERRYSFELNDRGHSITVVAPSPPDCSVPSRVAVTGIVQRPLRLDALHVVCNAEP